MMMPIVNALTPYKASTSPTTPTFTIANPRRVHPAHDSHLPVAQTRARPRSIPHPPSALFFRISDFAAKPRAVGTLCAPGCIMAKNHGKQIKDDEQYEALRDKGYSKEKSARIANANNANRSKTGEKGGHASKYEDRSKEDLYKKARQVGIEGRSRMNKGELIDALRNH